MDPTSNLVQANATFKRHNLMTFPQAARYDMMALEGYVPMTPRKEK
jgi:hypothetical protein